MFRKISIPVVVLSNVILLALPGLGLAALPKKGGVYQGTLHANSPTAVSKTIKLTVLASGLRAGARFFCGSGRPSNLITFAVRKDGSFSGFSNTGSLTVWSIVGRFTSAT